MSEPRTTVVIADDHPVYRRGLARAIADRPDLRLLGDYGDGAEVLAGIAELAPQVAVLDIAMPKLDGIQVLKALERDAHPTAVLLLSGADEAEGLYLAVAAGARGYLVKTAELEEICDAIRAVARGETVFSPELQGALAQQIRARELEPRPLLSARELDVIRRSAAGANAATIAEDLHLSIATVRTHIQNAYQKLGVSDRAAAVATAMRLGLIE